jgi:hypothetical protein
MLDRIVQNRRHGEVWVFTIGRPRHKRCHFHKVVDVGLLSTLFPLLPVPTSCKVNRGDDLEARRSSCFPVVARWIITRVPVAPF